VYISEAQAALMNRCCSIKAKASLTVRMKIHAGLIIFIIDDLSDPVFFNGKDIAQLIKATPGITG